MKLVLERYQFREQNGTDTYRTTWCEHLIIITYTYVGIYHTRVGLIKPLILKNIREHETTTTPTTITKKKKKRWPNWNWLWWDSNTGTNCDGVWRCGGGATQISCIYAFCRVSNWACVCVCAFRMRNSFLEPYALQRTKISNDVINMCVNVHTHSPDIIIISNIYSLCWIHTHSEKTHTHVCECGVCATQYYGTCTLQWM